MATPTLILGAVLLLAFNTTICEMKCPEGALDAKNFCLYSDECESSPCQYGACDNTLGRAWCDCSEGYGGILCDSDIDECESSPCQYGTCDNTWGSFRCECSEDYSGTLCDSDFDECKSSPNPCQYGTCENTWGSFRCECLEGYSGTLCDTDIDECESSPCHNGTCENTWGSFRCDCLEGYSGTLCDTDIDECESSPCHNGTCRNTAGSFRCDCLEGYQGTLCDTDIDECRYNLSEYGTCRNTLGSFRCDCLEASTATRGKSGYIIGGGIAAVPVIAIVVVVVIVILRRTRKADSDNNKGENSNSFRDLNPRNGQEGNYLTAVADPDAFAPLPATPRAAGSSPLAASLSQTQPAGRNDNSHLYELPTAPGPEHFYTAIHPTPVLGARGRGGGRVGLDVPGPSSRPTQAGGDVTHSPPGEADGVFDVERKYENLMTSTYCDVINSGCVAVQASSVRPDDDRYDDIADGAYSFPYQRQDVGQGGERSRYENAGPTYTNAFS